MNFLYAFASAERSERCLRVLRSDQSFLNHAKKNFESCGQLVADKPNMVSHCSSGPRDDKAGFEVLFLVLDFTPPDYAQKGTKA